MNLVIANRQRLKKINARLLRKIVRALFVELKIAEAELGINLVGAREMALVNETFLQHEGATDVITFGYDNVDCRWPMTDGQLHGELFVCVEVALAQAKDFRTSWQTEVVRYVVHGVLHLLGYDDLQPARRRTMKRQENRLVRRLGGQFTFAQL